MPKAFKIAYDGRRFKGSARQPGHRTVEGAILKALERLGALKKGKEAKFESASRTDKGVSSLGNVIVFDTDMEGDNIVLAMNGTNAQDGVWFLGWADVPVDFRPRHARERWYRYIVPSRSSLTGADAKMDIDVMKEVAARFTGEHDFRSFSKLDKAKKKNSTVRTIERIDVLPLNMVMSSSMHGTYSEVGAVNPKASEVPFHEPREFGFVIVDIYGQSFLWQMVRRLVGAMVGAATGKVTIGDIDEGLSGKSKNFEVLPAENLILMDVRYDLEFKTVKQTGGAEKLLNDLEEKRIWPLLQVKLFHELVMDRIVGR